MKFCPVCQTRYDEEVLRFCIKDGAPLVDENPSFTKLPSESEEGADDIGEETLINRNHPSEQSRTEGTSQRIVIPTAEEEKAPVRAKAAPQTQPPPQKSNTALVVLATMFGTFTVLALLFGVWWIFSRRNAANSNTNKSINVNTSNSSNFNQNLNTNNSSLNTNFNTNANTNANTNTNTNTNTDANANLNDNAKTPTPTRTPTPKPSVTPETNANSNPIDNTNSVNTNSTPRPTVTPTPLPTPPTQNTNFGIINNRATSLPKPAYPPEARQANASGEVRVQITVDESGNVTSAKAISGSAFLRPSAENAARQARFNPFKSGDQAIKATGFLVYNFIPAN